MSLWNRLTHWLDEHRPSPYAEGSGEDVAIDPNLASSRATGGEYTELSGDRGSVTGTGRTEEFVGRIAGDDLGYAGETGAERRAEALRADADGPADRGPAPDRGTGSDAGGTGR